MTVTVTRTEAFIGGAFVPSSAGAVFETYSPSTGELLGTVSECDSPDVDLAVAAGREAFNSGVWSKAPPHERKQVLMRLADLVEENALELAALDAMDAGKPITECESEDIPEVVRLFRWYAEATDKIFGKVTPTHPESLGLITREPVGVVGIVLPWNFPLVMMAYKCAPALAAGCSVIAKPAELAPLSALRLAELAARAGVPPGVLSVLPGRGTVTGRAIGTHPDIDAVSFTGSTATGREFLRYAADTNLKNVVLELGGKSPQIVLPDMVDDMERVVEDLAIAAFSNAGQNCTAGSRILVPRRTLPDFARALAAAADAIRVGDAMDRRTVVGPLINEAALRRVERTVEGALGDGAVVHAGGGRILEESGGYFFPPTVVSNVDPDADLLRKELFAPVTCLVGYESRDDALRIANDTEYGLAATIWTHDLDEAIQMGRGIRAGTVAVNGYSEGDLTTPFGGHRMSGFGGRDGGLEGMEQFTEIKTMWVSLS